MSRTQSVEICQAQYPDTGDSICSRSVWDDKEKLCIFHCQLKSAEEFETLFLMELKHVNETESVREARKQTRYPSTFSKEIRSQWPAGRRLSGLNRQRLSRSRAVSRRRCS